MAEPGFLFGAIVCHAIQGLPSAARYRVNEKALAALPEEWTPGEVLLCRKMFSFGASDDDTPFYRNQIIHFGASYNHLDTYWAKWIFEFEMLLTTMCWNEAWVIAHMDLVYQGTYKWIAQGQSLTESIPVKKFVFEGGPRSFDNMS